MIRKGERIDPAQAHRLGKKLPVNSLFSVQLREYAGASTFTAAGFGNWFRAQCDKAKLSQCSAHGLRKACARRLAEAGCTPHEIAAITGHERLREVQRYAKGADQKRLALEAMNKLATKVSAQSHGFDKTG